MIAKLPAAAKLAAGATIGVGVFGLAQVPSAAATDIPVFHWNKKGGCVDMNKPNVQRGNCGGFEAANHLINRVVNAPNRPWHVTLNEVCIGQFNQINVFLNAVGYSGRFVATNPNASPQCGQHGNAVFTLGTPSSFATWTFTSQTGELDVRRVSCWRMGTFVGNRKVCVSHLTNGSSSVRYNQDLAAAERSTNWNSNLPTVAGLDRNSTAQEYAWNASYKEIDSNGRGTAYSYELSRGKIDWVYGSFNGNAQNSAAVVECGLGGMSSTPGRFLSDHCLIRGKFVI